MVNDLKKGLLHYEGAIPFMYLDALGNVTAGAGHLLADVEAAQSLPFTHINGIPATPEEIAAEFNYMRSFLPAMGRGYYARKTVLRLSSDAISTVLDGDIAAKERDLSARISGFADFPTPVKQALTDMAFQCGINHLISGFPHLVAAVRARNWMECAEHCHRKDAQQERNDATANLFRVAGKTTHMESA